MSHVAKLKKKAAELELKRQFDKAIAVYVELLESFDEHAHELDVALFNRVGDLLVRQGNIADAVNYYEKAVDHYTDGGFFNNAIALCNKILRHSPGRTSIHYKLGRISAKKGFKNDAKQNYLEYADRMQKAGNLDEAFRALKEFADLCPDQDDIRLMLAEQLSKHERREEAVEQLQLLHERYVSEGREIEASATVKRMKALDPAAQPRAGGGPTAQKSGDLVFLDLDAPTPRGTPMPPMHAMPPGLPARKPTPVSSSGKAPPGKKAASKDLTFIELDPDPEPQQAEPPLEPEMPDPMPEPISESIPDDGRPSDLELAQERGVPSEPEPLDLDLSAVNSGSEGPPPLEGITRLEEFTRGTETPEAPLIGLQHTQLEDVEDTFSRNPLDIEPTVLSPLDEEIPPIARDEIAEPPAPPPQRQAPRQPPLRQPPPRQAPPPRPAPVRSAPQPPAAAAHGANDLELILPEDAVAPPREQRTSKEMLAELDPPLARNEAQSGSSLVELDLPAPPKKKSAPPPLVPSLTLDDEFAERLEESKSKSRPNAGKGSASDRAAVIDPDDETEGSTVAPRDSTMMAAQSVEMLETAVEREPGNWTIRRQLGEAMLESGDREGGLRELEAAMVGAERAGDLDHAAALAEEIARIDPGTIRHHQKRVEFAFRTNDKPRLIEAYLSLADALMRTEQMEKSRAVYQRVLDLAPDDIRAQAALESFAASQAAQAAKKAARRAQSASPTPVHGESSNGAFASDADFVNLGDWLREDEGPKDTRMVVPEHEPTGDEEADFQDMLRKFKQGIAQNVDEEDHQAHYDLGVAFKEMGLLDEAIAEFQKALRSPSNRAPTYEALGQCFIEKEQFAMAYTVLNRGLNEQNMTDDQLVGVLYLLGRCAESMGKGEEALTFYQRVFVVDITFRDVADRIAEVERAVR